MKSDKLTAIAPYLGVVSAILMFFSWIVTNALVETSSGARMRANRVLERQSEYTKHADIMRQLSNVEKQLTRIEIRQPHPVGNLTSAQESINSVTVALQRVQLLGTDVTNLIKFSAFLESVSDDIEPDDEFQSLMQSIECAKSLYESYWTLRNDFEQEKTEFLGVDSVSLSNPPENWAQLEPVAIEYIQEIRNLWKAYLPIQNRLLELSEEISRKHMKRADCLGAISTVSKWLSCLIFCIGSVATIYGKFVEVRIRGRR